MLGHYQIVEKLGAGGMGEVYKARDTRLNRFVAIKVLAPGTTADPGRKRRFVQEAQSASALNHPNIVVIHDINSQDGLDYMVMEYVAGKTLDVLIPREGMRFDAALRLAIPIASALAAAHGARIIHRDIKPTNIMVSDDGRVKVLDFGLAKLTEEAVSEASDETCTAAAHTEEGAVLGTAAYMSPEQAEGRKVDARSDIFSFGALLYEMVTGRRAFAGGSRVATLSAILKEDPAWPAGIPRDLDQILRRSLRKDAARRYQHMDDLRIALEDLKEESESGSAGVVAPPASVTSRSTPAASTTPDGSALRAWPFGKAWIAGAALLAVISAAAGWLAWQKRGASNAPSDVTASYKLRQLTADAGLTTMPALSADGKFLAYASDRASQGGLDIWVQPLTEGARPIRITTDPADDTSPAFSPDGGQIVFWSQRGGGGIYVVPALGGDERFLARGGGNARFSPDGKSVAYSTSGQLLWDSKVFVVPAAGGEARQVGADIGWTSSPMWSPDGKWLLVDGMGGANQLESREFWMTPAEGGGKSIRTGIFKHMRENHLAFFDYDWRGEELVFSRTSEAWSLSLDPGSWRPREFRKLVGGTGQLRGIQGSQSRFVFGSADEQHHLWTLPMNPLTGKTSAPARPLPHSGGSQSNPSLSNTGRMVYSQFSPGRNEVRVREGLEGEDHLVASVAARAEISPDGSQIGYSASPGGLFVISPDGGPASPLIDPNERVSFVDWMPDGSRMLFWHGAPIRYSTIDPRTRQRDILISHPTLNIHAAAPSPDGKWVAFILADRGRALVLAPLRGGKAAEEAEWITVIASPPQQSKPWWSPDGKLLYFISDRDRFGCIWALRIDPVSKRPGGEPLAVLHQHEARRSLNMGPHQFGPAFGKDQLVFGMLEQTANIWIAEPAPKP